MTSEYLRKLFAKDYSLPITIFCDPYFSYYLKLYDSLFDCLKKYDIFLGTLAILGEDIFKSYRKNISDKIIKQINTSPAYLQLRDNKFLTLEVKSNYKDDDLYTMNNIDRSYISLDLVQANYQALRYLDPNIVLNYNTYDDFINFFTDIPYFQKSKYLRQLIFGNLNAKLQQKVEKYIMLNEILPKVLDIFSKDNIFKLSNDEIIISNESLIQIPENFDFSGFRVRVEYFTLKSLGNKPFFYKKSLSDDKITFKKIPDRYLAECYKYYLKEEINDMDLSTIYDDRIVLFQDRLFDSCIKENT